MVEVRRRVRSCACNSLALKSSGLWVFRLSVFVVALMVCGFGFFLAASC